MFFICADLEKDPVGPRVLDAIERLFAPAKTGLVVDGRPVWELRDSRGDSFLFVPTGEVLSHAYPAYLPVMKGEFASCDFAALVNWHSGRGDDKPLFTAHSTGDTASGVFGPCAPLLLRNVLLGLERLRLEAGLDTFATQTEGTRWSGVAYGLAPELILEYPVPLIDIEIGSGPASWANTAAAEVVAKALLEVFTSTCDSNRVRNLLCAGGVHLEWSYAEAVLRTRTEFPLAVAHILPNIDLVRGGYQQEAGRARLESCLSSIAGGAHCFVYHDDVKAPYKAAVIELGAERKIPVVKYRKLRDPAGLDLWPSRESAQGG